MGPSGPADPVEPAGQDGRNGHRGHGSPAQLSAWLLVIGAVVAIIVVEHQHLAFLFGVLIFVVALLVSVMLHEFGHFATAKRFHMKVTQFFVGFGQTLWSTFRGETEYGVKALPFGGFVKITGMTRLEEIDVADEPRSFRNQPGWQRIIVLAAGSFMHFALAMFLLFLVAFGIGQANDNTNVISSIATCVPASVTALNSANPCAGHNLGKSPAEVAGIKPNDKIISIDGRAVGNWNQLHTALASQKAGQTVPVVVRRDGRNVTLSITLAGIPKRSVPYLGVEPAVLYQRSGFFSAWAYAGTQFADTLTSSASAIAKLPAAIPDLFNANRAKTPAGQVSSVVGVGEVTGDVVQAALPWQVKLTIVLYLIASLNIFVGAFNLLPLLPLDGGHLAVVIFERIRAWFARIRGRPDPGLVDIQRLVPLSLLVFVVLVGFGTLLIAADIFNPVHLQV
ncbi:MAG TPA: site-2 protease family protein [Streptosporangiaceae bacterium]|jgi:membrane-associated protease RseP (regulator of RpoE activity)|nr:site-2 protease family protein [Streptosporangiaceae bacterium]